MAPGCVILYPNMTLGTRSTSGSQQVGPGLKQQSHLSFVRKSEKETAKLKGTHQ